MTRTFLLLAAASLAFTANAASLPTAEKSCRIVTDTKGNRTATCALAESKVEAKDVGKKAQKAAPKTVIAKELDCKAATTPTDKLICLAAMQGAAEVDGPAEGNEIG